MQDSRCARQQTTKTATKARQKMFKTLHHFFLVGHHFTAFLLISAFVFDGTAKSFPFLFVFFLPDFRSSSSSSCRRVNVKSVTDGTIYRKGTKKQREKTVVPPNGVRTPQTLTDGRNFRRCIFFFPIFFCGFCLSRHSISFIRKSVD